MRRPTRSLLAACAALWLLVGCSAGDGPSWVDQLPERVTIATGGTTGIYHAYGTALGEVLESEYGVDVEVVATEGSLKNLRMVADGEADLAFSAADALGDAVAGTGSFDEPEDLRTLARIYDDFEHLVVRADSDIEEIADLRGRRVSVGAEGSGTALIAHRVLEAADVDVEDLEAVSHGLTDSIHALRAGQIEAFFWSGGHGTPGLEELSTEVPIRLVPLDVVVDELREDYGYGYRHGVVPQGSYELVAEVETMAVPNVLVVSEDLPDGAAHALLAALFTHRSVMDDDVPAVEELDEHQAIYTAPATLHDGALRYYREVKT